MRKTALFIGALILPILLGCSPSNDDGFTTISNEEGKAFLLSALESHADAQHLDPMNETKSRYEQAKSSNAYSLFDNALFRLTNTGGADALKAYEYRCDFVSGFYECNRGGSYTRLYKNSDGRGILTKEGEEGKTFAFASDIDYYLEMTKVDILYHSRHALDWVLDKYGSSNSVLVSKNPNTGMVRFDINPDGAIFEFDGPLLRLYAKYSGDKYVPGQTLSEIQRFQYNVDYIGNTEFPLDESYQQFELPDDYVFEGACLDFAWQVVRPPYHGD